MLGEAEAALGQLSTELKNLPFETRRAEAELEFADDDYKRKRSAGTAIAGRDIFEAKSHRDVARAMVEELRIVLILWPRKSSGFSTSDAIATQLELLTDEKRARPRMRRSRGRCRQSSGSSGCLGGGEPSIRPDDRAHRWMGASISSWLIRVQRFLVVWALYPIPTEARSSPCISRT